jgi:flagellar protein FliL
MATAVDNTAAPPAKKGGWLLLIIVSVVASAAGFFVPRLLMHDAMTPAHQLPDAELKPVVLSFGEVVVNLGEERLTRYLRLKIMLVVDGAHEKSVQEHLEKQKAFLKSWLIGYLSDLSLQEVSRAVGVNRLRREIRDQFNAMLWPDGRELVQDVLFDEFVVQ